MRALPKPTPALISRYLKEREKKENYRLQELSLGLLFKELCPENTKIEHVLLKVSALNDFYSTRIFGTYSVAKHILSKDVDRRLRQDDYTLVNDIARVDINGKTRNFYSFASKYCSHHSADTFPIYDSFVDAMLIGYQKVDGFASFKPEDLKNYPRFVEIVDTFRSHYSLSAFNLRQIDVFLWLGGKDYFPRSYQRGKDKKGKAGVGPVGTGSRKPSLMIAQSSKYDALREYLEKQASREFTVHLSEAPKLLGFSFPPSAFKHQAFWANQSSTEARPWAKAWQDAGYKVVSYKLSEADGWVRFRRIT